MNTVVFDGKSFAAMKEELIRKKISGLKLNAKLVSIFFAEDPGGVLYTNLKQAAAERVGISFHPEELSLRMTLASIKQVVRHYSGEKQVDAVLVQKPAQDSVSEVKEVWELGFEKWWEQIVVEINPEKDVDCLHPTNLTLVYRGKWKILPAAVRAVISILETVVDGFELKGRKAAVIGRSELIGKPLAYVLAQKGAEVKLCGSQGLAARNIGSQFIESVRPQELDEVISESDLVVSAAGKMDLITGTMVRKGAVVIDVGWPLGDVDFFSVKKKASFITPVPGGVGPVTVVSLIENLLDILC